MAVTRIRALDISHRLPPFHLFADLLYDGEGDSEDTVHRYAHAFSAYLLKRFFLLELCFENDNVMFD